MHLDSPDGLIDDLPAEQVIAETCTGALDLLAEHHGGLRCDDPTDAALLARFDTRLGQIATSPTSQADRVEQLLVLLAVELPADQLGRVLEHVRLQLLPSTLERRERDAQHSRDLHLRPNRDGSWDLRATLTPQAGEQLFTALAAEARRDPANPLDTHAREALRTDRAAATQAAADTTAAQAASTAAQQQPDEAQALSGGGGFDEVRSGLLDEDDLWDTHPLGSPDTQKEPVRPRRRGQRLHDAFSRLLTRYLDHGLGGVRSKTPVQLTTVIHDRTLHGAPGAPPARGGSGQPLARSLVQRLWCNGHLTALLVTDGMIPLGVVHTQRNVTAIETKALLVQYGNRCPGIGCCTGAPDPLTPLVVHHLNMFSTTGQTSLTTSLPCCENLHADIHLSDRVIRLRDGSHITQDGYLHPPE